MLTRSILVVGGQLLAASVCAAQAGGAQPPARGTTTGNHIVRSPDTLQWTPFRARQELKWLSFQEPPINLERRSSSAF